MHNIMIYIIFLCKNDQMPTAQTAGAEGGQYTLYQGSRIARVDGLQCHEGFFEISHDQARRAAASCSKTFRFGSSLRRTGLRRD